MSGTNNSSAAPPSYFDKAKDAVHSVVGNFTGGHDDKETTSKSFAPKVSSACTAVIDKVYGEGETSTKAMKDTDGSIMRSVEEAVVDKGSACQSKAVAVKEEVIDIGGSCSKSKAVEAGDAMKKVPSDAGKACSMVVDDAKKTVTLKDAACLMVVEDTEKSEALKDAHNKPLSDAKLMDGASDIKSEKKIDVEEKSAQKMDPKVLHKKMDDKMDHKKIDDEKMGKTGAEKQVAGSHMKDDVCEKTACVKNEEPKSHGNTATDVEDVCHVAGEACSKKGCSGTNECC